jgi:ABC-type transporter Mla MlaB component
MLKISIQKTEESAVLRLEGHLAGVWIAELRTACARFQNDQRSLSLDLAGVVLIERPGFELLASLISEGVKIAGASAFQRAQLAETADARNLSHSPR